MFFCYNKGMSKKKNKGKKKTANRRNDFSVWKIFTKIFGTTFLLVITVGIVLLLSTWLVKGGLDVKLSFPWGKSATEKGEDWELVEKKGSEAYDIEEGEEQSQNEEELVESEEAWASDLGLIDYTVDGDWALDMNGRVLAKRKDVSKEDGKITLLFAGDISFDDSYTIMNTMRKRDGGILDSFSREILDEMINADVFMLNNEFTYTNRGTPTEGKQYTFRSNPENVELLDELGVDIVSIANNHTYDYGEISLLDTLDTLIEDRMPFVGAGREINDASQTVYFKIGDTKIAYISATQIERLDTPDTKGAKENAAGTFRCWTEKLILEKVEQAKENCDIVVTYIHWGTEGTDEIDWAQRDLAKALAEAGADLIVGDHPHVLQPLASIEGVPVIYSLGNYWFNSKDCDNALVKVTLENGNIKSYQFIPAKQSGCYTAILQGTEKDRVLDYMRSISPTVTIDEDGYVTY